MSCSHARPRVGPLALVCTFLSACSESPGTAPEVAEEPPAFAADLSLLAPPLEQSDLVHVESVVLGGPNDRGAVRSSGSESMAQIMNARTKVGFLWEEAYAEGSHDYTGTAGRVETTVNVDFEGQHVGTYTAIRQESSWLSTETTKHIFAYAGIPIDKTCGLSVTGYSTHSAWWQFFQIRSAPTYGEAVDSSRGGPVRQTSCSKTTTSGNPGGGDSQDGTGMTCTYLITYDRNTLEIYDVELLGCQTTGILF